MGVQYHFKGACRRFHKQDRVIGLFGAIPPAVGFSDKAKGVCF